MKGPLWITDTGFERNGRPVRLLSGEMHYFRIPRPYWADRLAKARAFGLNTVCTYLCWNLHEPRPGEFDFTGELDNLDVAEFIRLAGDAGLMVLLRPGPYICAEWDLGGLPPWLLRDGDVRLRCCDERFMEAVERYAARVGEELAGLQVTRDGPVVALQVENEYGSFGNDAEYLRRLAVAWRQAGFDVPFFTSDGPSDRALAVGTLDNTLAMVNFAEDPEKAGAVLRRHRPTGPIMCGEFWVGWFDHWGSPRKGHETAKCLDKLSRMLDAGWSVNLYMFHGGTNFGFTAGANFSESYKPDVTSYDYDAPLDESGRPTPKYFALSELFKRHLSAEELSNLPALPETPGPIGIPPFRCVESAALFDCLPEPVRSPMVRSIETFGQNFGFALYRADAAGLGSGKLTVREARDFAQIFVNGQRVGTLDRRLGESGLDLDLPDTGPVVLDILVEAMGRVNFGPRLIDRKGITEAVVLDNMTLMNWQVFNLPMDDLSAIPWSSSDVPGPAFHRGRFTVDQPGDTFLDMSRWSKGVVWVNGRNLGRYWNIGPQQTLYVPGVWLNRGENEVVVFDQLAAGRQPLAGLEKPVLG